MVSIEPDVRTVGHELPDVAVMPAMDLGQKFGFVSIGSVDGSVDVISPVSRRAFEPLQTRTKQEFHRPQPRVDGPVGHDVAACREAFVKRVVPKRDRIVEERVVLSEEYFVEFVEQGG